MPETICTACGWVTGRDTAFCPKCGKSTKTQKEQSLINFTGLGALTGAVSFLVPIIGIILGIALLFSNKDKHRHLGKQALILAVVGIAFIGFCLIMQGAFN